MRIQARYHWLVGPGDVRLEPEEFDSDDIADDDVLCRTVVSAISPGTELAACDGLEPLRPNAAVFPRWLGYMNVAEVLHAGRNVRAEFPEGILVYSHAAHRSHFRMAASKILAVLPRQLEAEEASVAYLYRLAWVGLRRGRVEAGRNVAVVGLGAIGQCAVELAVKFGSRCLAVSDHANARLSAQQIGAVGISREDAEANFVNASPNEDARFELVLVTTNSWRDWQIALSLARFGAIISVIGFPGRGQGSPSVNPLLPSLFYDRQLTIMSAGLAGPGAGEGREDPAVLKRDIVQILNWISDGELKPSRLRMGVHPAADLAGAYRRLKAPDRGVGTLLLDWKEA